MRLVDFHWSIVLSFQFFLSSCSFRLFYFFRSSFCCSSLSVDLHLFLSFPLQLPV